jgi:NAD(P)H-hydrate repair Nnr-like enzyme with NAD(P)H-hydrate dehydratase domain
MIFAGAPGYIGAAALCAMAAGRAGAGIINLAVSRGLVGPISTLVPEAGFTHLPDADIGSMSRRINEAIAKKAEKCSAFVVGPGLGEDEYANGLVSALLGLSAGAPTNRVGFGLPAPQVASESTSLLQFEKPILVDADGLNALARIDQWYDHVPEFRLVLTPHIGEFSRLTGRPADEMLNDPQGAAVEAARAFKQTIVLKGNPTVVTDGSVVVRTADSPPSLATAGSGDVFAGFIGALLAQGLSAIDAASLAAYVGVRAARRLEGELGTLGVIASDLPRAIAIELAAIEGE